MGRYGHREGTRPPNFIATGTGRVMAIDTTSRAGRLLLDVEPYDGVADVQLQVGPVVRGTALRDAMPFIAFNQFSNQLEYADVSKAMHARLTEMLSHLRASTHEEALLTFHGTFTLGSSEEILLTPVLIQPGAPDDG